VILLTWYLVKRGDEKRRQQEGVEIGESGEDGKL